MCSHVRVRCCTTVLLTFMQLIPSLTPYRAISFCFYRNLYLFCYQNVRFFLLMTHTNLIFFYVCIYSFLHSLRFFFYWNAVFNEWDMFGAYIRLDEIVFILLGLGYVRCRDVVNCWKLVSAFAALCKTCPQLLNVWYQLLTIVKGKLTCNFDFKQICSSNPEKKFGVDLKL